MYQICKHGKQDGELCEECSAIVKEQNFIAENKLQFNIEKEFQDYVWEKCNHNVGPMQNWHCCKQCAINFIILKMNR